METWSLSRDPVRGGLEGPAAFPYVVPDQPSTTEPSRATIDRPSASEATTIVRPGSRAHPSAPSSPLGKAGTSVSIGLRQPSFVATRAAAVWLVKAGVVIILSLIGVELLPGRHTPQATPSAAEQDGAAPDTTPTDDGARGATYEAGAADLVTSTGPGRGWSLVRSTSATSGRAWVSERPPTCAPGHVGATARWDLELHESGHYRIEVHVPSALGGPRRLVGVAIETARAAAPGSESQVQLARRGWGALEPDFEVTAGAPLRVTLNVPDCAPYPVAIDGIRARRVR